MGSVSCPCRLSLMVPSAMQREFQAKCFCVPLSRIFAAKGRKRVCFSTFWMRLLTVSTAGCKRWPIARSKSSMQIMCAGGSGTNVPATSPVLYRKRPDQSLLGTTRILDTLRPKEVGITDRTFSSRLHSRAETVPISWNTKTKNQRQWYRHSTILLGQVELCSRYRMQFSPRQPIARIASGSLARDYK